MSSPSHSVGNSSRRAGNLAIAPLIVAITVLVCGGGCSNVEKAKPQPTSVRAQAQAIPLDVPEVMRGTIASETIVLGYSAPTSSNYHPIVVRGYGLVVGLNGTGSRDIPPPLRAHMLAEAAKGGFGSPRYGPNVASQKPETLLNSTNTAVVIVEAIIPQGAVKGTKFDVRVFADPVSRPAHSR